MTAAAARLIVEVGFSGPGSGSYLHLDDPSRGRLDTATLGPDDLWVDVSSRVMRVTTRRGATRGDGPTLRYEGGTATVVLHDPDRRFDPTNLAGPYVAGGVTQIEPMRKIRIRAVWGGVTYGLWRGFTDEWVISYPGPNKTVVTVTCLDAFAVFAAYDRDASVSVGAGEDSGARVDRILDSVGWPAADRMIDVGDSVLQSTTLADNALAELQLTGDSELGELFMDADGRVRFRHRLALAEELRSTRPNALFGRPSDESVDTTINLATNPSLETDTTGWSAGGSAPPTLARSATRARFGTYSLLATWATGGFLPQLGYPVTGLTVGKTYTISVYVWVPTGSPGAATIVAGTDHFGDGTALKDQWVRLTWTGVATAPTWSFQLWPTTAPTAGQQIWIDGLQVEEGASATTYTDGDQAGAEWDGTAHASTSRRLPELPYADVGVDTSGKAIYNWLSIARAGGTAQVVEDAASRDAYLTRTHRRHDLLLTTDTECLDYASALLGQSSQPEVRFTGVKLKPRRDARLWPQALGREIGDRVAAVRRPPGGGDPIEREVWVRGIEHDIEVGGSWTTNFVFQSATRSTWLVLDNPTLGVLDSNVLAY